MDFDIKRCTRRCAATDRELEPNEAFYSVLLKDGADLLRQDFAESAWVGPPEGTVGCWKSRMPSAQPKKVKLAPNQVMLNLFEELAERPEKRQLRYLLALMLVRRRVFQFVEPDGEVNSEINDEPGEHWLYVQHAKDSPVAVEAAEPADGEEADALQMELTTLLYAEEEGT